MDKRLFLRRKGKEQSLRIRPCIDIHNGKVKQIVGGTLHLSGTGEHADGASAEMGTADTCIDAAADASGARANVSTSTARENFVSDRSADYYASVYREKNLPGGHVILLNSRMGEPEMYEADRRQALAALRTWPGGMQIGGGITPENAEEFLDAGASHVIVTSFVFRNGRLDENHLERLISAVGREHLVLDLSCRRWRAEKTKPPDAEPSDVDIDERVVLPVGSNDGTKDKTVPAGDKNADAADQYSAGTCSYRVVTDRWQKWTNLEINNETLNFLSEYCDEFLIHAADVEGKRGGVEQELVAILGNWLEQRRAARRPFLVTYAGGVHSLEDLDLLKKESCGLLDVTVGSALDLFGGDLSLDELVSRAQ